MFGAESGNGVTARKQHQLCEPLFKLVKGDTRSLDYSSYDMLMGYRA